MKYIVGVREVHYSYVEIEAGSPYDAKERVVNGEGVEVDLQYSYTCDSYDWTVEKKENEKNGI